MFTGLIEKVGRLADVQPRGNGQRLSIRYEPWDDDPLVEGESVAVQGVCLTVTECRHPGRFVSDVLAETMDRTALGRFAPGSLLNLERALRPRDRLGGHIVSGHIDGTGRIEAIDKSGNDYVLRVACVPDLIAGVILKGSIALDGISLTIAARAAAAFDVCIIPQTWSHTSLRERSVGDPVNLETDMLGKYVRHHLARTDARPGLTFDDLARTGFMGPE